MIEVFKTVDSWRERRSKLSGSLGFVPTMGNLHAGHLALVERAVAENNNVIVSIFVNPTQFNNREDYDKYLRTLDEDIDALQRLNVDFVFCPDDEEMYPDDYEVRVFENNIANVLEGEFRPGHFTGMLSVVLKLLNIAGADRAYFGEKDYQQLLLVKKMVEAFFIETEIVACPTIRDANGLALSSRNSRLSEENKRKASLIYKYISDKSMSLDSIKQNLSESGFDVEYVAEMWGRRLIATNIAGVRLIDNVKI